jgi:hypothetical protein
MATLYTKYGRPLQLADEDLFSRSGKHVGRIVGDKVYSPNGRYAGTVVGDRVIYRSIDSATMTGMFAARLGMPTLAMNSVATADWGDEPNFPD